MSFNNNNYNNNNDDYDYRPNSSYSNIDLKKLDTDYNKLYNNVIKYEEYKNKHDKNWYGIFGKTLIIMIVIIIFLYFLLKIINLTARKQCSIDEDVSKGLDYRKSGNLLCKTETLIDNVANFDKILISDIMRDKDGHKKYLYDHNTGDLIFNKPNPNNERVTLSEILYNKN